MPATRSTPSRWPGLFAAGLLLCSTGGCAFIPLQDRGAAFAPRDPNPPILGVDASALPIVRAQGGRFGVHGATGDALEIYRAYGVNTIRLRLFVDPAPEQSAVLQVVNEAREARRLGFRLVLDLHYSDNWADPGQQTKPAAWAGLTESALEDVVEDYTRDVLNRLREAGALPDLVQIGNEITNGFLWPEGRLNAPPGDNWPRFARILSRATHAVRSTSVAAPGGWGGRRSEAEPSVHRSPGIVLHLDAGGDNAACRAFLDQAESYRIDFDVVGVSYYPWWHGGLDALEQNLADLALRYHRPLLLCETAYPWTLQWSDDTTNLVGRPDQLLSDYPATPEGQTLFVMTLRHMIAQVPRGLGLGLIYWSPDWVSTPGAGSAWENMTLFDFRGEALPALRALGAPAAGSGAPTPPASP